MKRPESQWITPFFTIWGGQAFSLLGSQLVQFSLIWWLTEKTQSATVLAIATMVGLLPQVFIGPIAGTLVDRHNRRLIMILADGLVAGVTLALAVVYWMDIIQIWHIYIALFIRAASGGFHWSAMQASTSLMIPKEHFSRIQGINQVLNGALNIGAAPLGALLIGLIPMQAILAIDVSTALLAIIPLCFISVPQPQKVDSTTSEQKESFWNDLRAGFRYVWSLPGLLLLMIVAMLINLVITPAFSLIPILVSKHFEGGAMQLAWLDAAAGIGIVLGGLILSTWGGFKRRVITTLGGLVFLGIGLFVLGLLSSAAFYPAVIITLLIGLSVAMIDGPLLAVVQDVVAPDMQGRVFTLIISAAKAMTPIGLSFAGPVADRFGVQSWYIIGGIVTIIFGVGSFFISPVINIEAKTVVEIESPDKMKDTGFENAINALLD